MRKPLTAAFLTLLIFAAGCGGEIRDPVAVSGGGGGEFIGGGGGGGDQGGGRSTSALVGVWQTTLVYRLETDVQSHEVTWSFRSDHTCLRSVAVTSVLADRTVVTDTPCTWRSGSGQVAVTWRGSPSPVTFRWSFEGFSPNRLVLDGVVYDRIR